MKIDKLGKFISEVSVRNKNGFVIDVFSVTNSLGFIKSTDYFSKEVFSKDITNYKIVGKNEFAYNPSRINVGSIDYLKQENKVAISPLYVVFKCSKELNEEYLKVFLKSPIGNTRIRAKTKGAVRDTLSFGSLCKIKVPILPVDQQLHIANLLSKAENLIDQRKESIRLLDEFLKSTFAELFIDRDFPHHKLGDLATKITDGEHKKPEYLEEGMPFISVKNITNGFLDFNDCKYVSVEDFNKFTKRCKPEFGDIIYTKVGATYGRASVVDTEKPFCLYVSVALIKPKKELVLPKFLQYAINHPYVKRQADKSIKGSGVPDLHLIEIKSFEIPLPSIELQTQFAQIVEKIEALKTQHQQSLQELENLYGSLSQKAFRGELCLKDDSLLMAAEPVVNYSK